MSKRALFIFRRDLRIEDNTGLIETLQESEEVIASFIFTPEQIKKNPYKSEKSLFFMLESLKSLEKSLKKQKGRLFFFYGKPEDVVKKCIDKLDVDLVVVNRDYTPYSTQRDQNILSICQKKKVSFKAYDDLLLNAPEDGLKENGEPYSIFTPYFRKVSKIPIPPPQKNDLNNYFTTSISWEMKKKPKAKESSSIKGGREEGLKLLKRATHNKNYSKLRDIPEEDATTHLSAHLKFGTLSIREVYFSLVKGLGKQSDLIRSLYWRDFFTQLAFFHPHVFQGAFHKKYDKLKWSRSKKDFQAWCAGKTGFPIVDAGMRELNTTGYMHNRVRMIVASFLTKDLHIDWRWGEKYFATHLVDYDPAVNNGNWQWAASTGADAQPYFRIFNPWAQQEKFDPDCKYIKKWVPELKDQSPQDIHGKIASSPMLDHKVEAKKTLRAYRR